MITKDYTQEEMRLYEETLVSDHLIAIRVHLMDLDHNVLLDISSKLLDGQVTISAKADISTRTLNATFLDPDATMGIDTGNASDGVLLSDRMIRAFYDVYVPQLTRADKWVSIPVFTGPITGMERTGLVVQLTGQGKETLAGPVWKTYSIPVNTNKVTAIKKIMKEAGEDRFGDLGTTTGVTGSVTSLTQETVAWSMAEDIAQSLDRDLYYDAWGNCSMRKKSETVVYTFKDGNGGSILEDPEVSYDAAEMFNVVKVIGKKPTGKGSPPSFTAYAPSSHPLSPKNLGRRVDGVVVPRYVFEIIENDKFTKPSQCETLAEKTLKTRLDESVEVKFESLVIPHIEPNDWCAVSTDKMNTGFRLSTATIPLNPTGSARMTVGYTKNQIINKFTIRGI